MAQLSPAIRTLLALVLTALFIPLGWWQFSSATRSFTKDRWIGFHNNASRLYDQGDFKRALFQEKQALRSVEDNWPADDIRVAVAHHSLARIHNQLGEHDEALACLDRALAIRRKAFAPNSFEILEVVSDLANVQHARRQYSEAEAAFNEAIGILETNRQLDRALLPSHLFGLYDVLFEQKRHAEGVDVLERAVALQEKYHGRNHPLVGKALPSLAMAYAIAGKISEAEAAVDRLLTDGALLQPDPQNLKLALMALAKGHADAGNADGARKYLKLSEELVPTVGRPTRIPG